MKISEHVFVERHEGFLYHVGEKKGDSDTIAIYMAAEGSGYDKNCIELTREEAVQIYRRLGHILKKQPHTGDKKGE